MTRPQRPCRQPHGTVARYVAGCSCLACCDAHAAYLREYRAQRKTGRTRLVDAEPARKHIAMLRSHGWHARAISEQAAVAHKTVCDISNGRHTRIRQESADAILTLTATPLCMESTALVPARPTLRVIERLRKQFTLQSIADAAGLTRKSLPEHGQRSVQACTAKRIYEAAARLRCEAAS